MTNTIFSGSRQPGCSQPAPCSLIHEQSEFLSCSSTELHQAGQPLAARPPISQAANPSIEQAEAFIFLLCFDLNIYLGFASVSVINGPLKAIKRCPTEIHPHSREIFGCGPVVLGKSSLTYCPGPGPCVFCCISSNANKTVLAQP